VELSAELNAPTAANQLGNAVLLAADSDGAGRSLLAGKGIESGAYVEVIHAPAEATLMTPVAALEALLGRLGPGVQVLGPPSSVFSGNALPGAMVEVLGVPVGTTGAGGQMVQTRILLFIPTAVEGGGVPVPLVVLLGATANEWERFREVFGRVGGSIVVYPSAGANAAPGSAAVLGQLAEAGRVAGTLRQGANDLWSFPTPGNRYVTLGLRPDDAHLDLTLTIFGPGGETIARIDNGFAGDTEVAADLFLGQAGVYVAEVSDFFQESGRYTLSIAQGDVPLYSGGGRIETGQAIQGELGTENQHVWTFDGTAGQFVSIVVEPMGSGFDTILNVYAPDGQRLSALDEGFSGDPEVVSGLELPLTGTYSIIVSSFSGQGGGYTISLNESRAGIANFYDAGDLVYGDVKQESLRPQEVQAWFFQARAGEQFVIEGRPLSSHLDLDIWLLDPAIERIAAADKFLAGEAERIEFGVTEDGQYIVLVQDYNGQAGDYEVSLQTTPVTTPESAGALSYGDQVMWGVHPGSASAWVFNGQEGDVIDVVVQPVEGGSDLIVALQGPDGLTVVEVDEQAAGQPEMIAGFTIPASGQWRIIIREFFGKGGGYELSLQRSP
jgi:hypothetical protein